MALQLLIFDHGPCQLGLMMSSHIWKPLVPHSLSQRTRPQSYTKVGIAMFNGIYSWLMMNKESCAEQSQKLGRGQGLCGGAIAAAIICPAHSSQRRMCDLSAAIFPWSPPSYSNNVKYTSQRQGIDSGSFWPQGGPNMYIFHTIKAFALQQWDFLSASTFTLEN